MSLKLFMRVLMFVFIADYGSATPDIVGVTLTNKSTVIIDIKAVDVGKLNAYLLKHDERMSWRFILRTDSRFVSHDEIKSVVATLRSNDCYVVNFQDDGPQIRQREYTNSIAEIASITNAFTLAVTEIVKTRMCPLSKMKIEINYNPVLSVWKIYYEGAGEYELPGYHGFVEVYTNGMVELLEGE